MTKDKRKNLTDSAKRRLRKRAQEAKRSKRRDRQEDDNWHSEAKMAVVTEANKAAHATAIYKACLRLREDGIVDKPRKLLSITTFDGNMLTYVG